MVGSNTGAQNVAANGSGSGSDENDIKYQLLGPSANEGSDDLLSGCSNNLEAVRRLQALLSEWLRMENLVVLTAAGCSIDCGGKIMTDLEKEVLHTIKEIDDLPNEMQGIIDERLKPDDTKIGFEQWLSYLVNSVYLANQELSPVKKIEWKNTSCSISHIEYLVNYISKAIYAECALTLPDDPVSNGKEEKIAPHISFISKLVTRDSNLGRTHLFTLNYDTLFEQAIELLGIQYFDGFSGRANARFDPSVYGLDIYYPGELSEGRVRRFDKFLHFYKLHGSIHWVLKDDEVRAQHSGIEQYVEYRKQTTSKEKANQLCDNSFVSNYHDFGILPTSNKFVQTLNMPYAHLFRAFQARLSAPQTFLMVIGYGFGDDHVTRIIETALMNPALILLVVEPDPTSRIIETISKYKELGKRAFVLTTAKKTHEKYPFEYATFNDFAKNILPDVQWLDDFLKLRQFEKQLQKNQPQQNDKGKGK